MHTLLNKDVLNGSKVQVKTQ